MANSNNMYGANLKEYALDVLKNKQVARSTMINWSGVIKNLPYLEKDLEDAYSN